MLIRTFFLSTFVVVLVECKEFDSVRIKLSVDLKNNRAYCDHAKEAIKHHKYIALEGGQIILETNYTSLVNSVSCVNINDDNKVLINNPEPIKRHNLTVNVTKEMSTTWKCTILLNKNNLNTGPLVTMGKDRIYTAAYCYMKVHVRRLISPQTILVNNMVLEQVRTDLSEKEVDYAVEYEYAANDMINITCAAFNNPGRFNIIMQNNYTDSFSKTSNSARKSNYYIGFSAKLHSEFNNTQTICILEQDDDETIVKITFIMQSEFKRIVSLKINNMIIRPKLKPHFNNYYVNYKYVTNQPVHVFCHIQRADMKLFVEDSMYGKKIIDNDSTYSMEASLKENSTIWCVANYVHNNTAVESTMINFTPEKGFDDDCPLRMDLPSSGIMLELYESNVRRDIYYEFEEGEILTLNCYTTCNRVVYLKFEDSANTNKNLNNISQTLDFSQQQRTLVKSCLMMEKNYQRYRNDTVTKRFTVYFHKAEFNPTTTHAPMKVLPNVSKSLPTDDGNEKDESDLVIIAASGVTLIVVVGVAIIIYKMRKRNLQRGPNEGHYENLQNQNTDSIPAHPVQWESNYAVPVDQRVDNETYSVPVKPDADMYATPIPKSERKKQEEEPAYASLGLYQNASGRRNILKHSQDSNYAEICSNLEDCYAKILPKNKRNMKNESHYANVANERQYVNINEAEPMYYEPNSAQRAEYANVNDGLYANRPAQEYVEPTYCEPHKRK